MSGLTVERTDSCLRGDSEIMVSLRVLGEILMPADLFA